MAEFSARLQTRVGALSLDVAFETAGGRLAVVGPNGAGKTSLFKALIGAVPVERGLVALGERRLLDTATQLAVAMEDRGLGYLPQSYALFPHLTVQQNVEFPMLRRVRDKGDRRTRAAQLLESFGAAHLATRRATDLSGGEMQRVALARALAGEPRALLLDEPLAAMDVGHRDEVLRFLVEHLTQLTLPTLVITHDLHEARALAHRFLVMEEGRVTQSGTYEELSSAPATPFVERFVQSRTGVRSANAVDSGG